ncbi:MAG: DUF4388 domain-containing protein [Deltaproteobacteria bacterium]|nr:DUF4388 domain-containing protein [Deltaproteobacteria bacterium]
MHEGIKGRLKDMSLIDIIQVLYMGRKTAAVNIGSEQGAGRIFVENGNVVHARFREVSGENALYNLLAWKDGDFEVEMDVKPEERTISGSAEALLLEGMKRLDESKQGGFDKERLFGVEEKESIHLIKKLIELGILTKKEG